jgi:hypothetical protein
MRNRVWTGFNWLKKGSVSGSCEHGNESSGTIKGGDYISFSRRTLFHGVNYKKS